MEFVALDLETSGLDPKKDRVIEIALVCFENGEIKERFSSLVNPKIAVDHHVLGMTGIRQEELDKAPVLSDLKMRILDFISDKPLIGHNLQFDLDFLRGEDLILKNRFYDTWHLATLLLPFGKSFSLEVLTKQFGLKHEKKHRAEGDALASISLFNFLLGIIQQFPSRLRKEISDLSEKSEFNLGELFNEDIFSGIKRSFNFNVTTYLQQEEEKLNSDNREAFLIATRLSEFTGQKEHQLLEFPCVHSLDEAVLNLIVKTIHKGRQLVITVPNSWYRQVFLASKVKTEIAGKVQTILPTQFKLDLEKLKNWRERNKLEKLYASVIAKVLVASFYLQTKNINLLDLSLTFEERDIWPQFAQTSQLVRLDSEKPVMLLSQSVFLSDAKLREQLLNQGIPILIWRANELRKELLKCSLFLIRTEELAQLKLQGEAVLNFFAKDKVIGEKIEGLLQNLKNIDTRLTLLLGIVAIFVRKHSKSDTYFKDLIMTDELWNEYDWQQVSFLSEKILAEFEDLKQKLKELGVTTLKENVVFNHLLRQIENVNNVFQKFFDTKQSILRLIKVCDKEVTLGYFDKEQFTKIQKEIKESQAQLVFVDQNLTTQKNFDYFISSIGLNESGIKTASISFNSGKNSEEIPITVAKNLGYFNDAVHAVEYQKILDRFLTESKNDFLVISNSFNATQTFYFRFKKFLEGKGFSVFAQGLSGGKMKIMEKIKENPRNAIIGTTRFFEKVEVNPIDRLLILQLPFQYPDDPLVLVQEKENAFTEVILPEAILKFKDILSLVLQFSSPNSKEIMVWDQKLTNSRYARDFWESLPSCFKIV